MDISNLRERTTKSVMSVGELNTLIKGMFDSSRILSDVSVTGEISNLICHRVGHLYFSLKDSEGQIRAVMFRSSAASLKFIPENGMKVTVRGSVSVYVRDGSYQIYVRSIQPDGIGSLYLAYEQLKAKLESEGLFSAENKKPIPKYPRAIGVITSPTGAAVRDIINIVSRRYPIAAVYLYPSLVQGDGAEDNLIEGLDYFDKSGLVDTVIIGRGGGSIEDLWAFNSEKLARKIFNVSVPVISAVGHETDFTICDFVSDLRAPTPSAGAELSTPDVRELILRVDHLRSKLDRALLYEIKIKRQRLISASECEVFKNPMTFIMDRMDTVKDTEMNLHRFYGKFIEQEKNLLAILVGKLNALNPLSVIERGYSIVSLGEKYIKSVSQLEQGDSIKIKFHDGTAKASVTGVNKIN